MERLDYPLTDLNGQTHTLRSLVQKDKFNLLLFYNNDCLGCTGRALPLAYDLSQSYPFVHLVVIHTTFGNRSYTAQDIKDIFTKGESPFPIYMEKSHELFDAFDCDGTPHWILMNDKFEVLHSFFGSQDGTQMKLEYAIREFDV
ncbi:MAG: hypothetical protein M9887_01080 [Chitinophagales bacterium]|nr:hypothetical protein [Chitinophagales bacterium]